MFSTPKYSISALLQPPLPVLLILSQLGHIFPGAYVKIHQASGVSDPKGLYSISLFMSLSFSLLPLPQWFVLNDTTSGRLHLRLEWLSLLTDQEALTEVSVNDSLVEH